jgi:peptide/nickel transport system permease protein
VRKNKLPYSCIVGFILLAIIGIGVFGAPIVSRYEPQQQDAKSRLEKPSAAHPMGTDRFGRDMLSRTLHGGKTTLLSAMLALTAALSIGLAIGLLAGLFHGSPIDAIFMRTIDVLLAFPFLVFAMVVAALFGTSFLHLLIAVVSVWWVSFARVARSVVIQAKQETSYAAAQVLGASRMSLAWRELLPKAVGPILVLASFELAQLLLAISALSFLGLGAQPPTPEWGSMLADGRDHFMQAPHLLLGPAACIMLTVLAFNLIGEGLRDRLDPYERTGM